MKQNPINAAHSIIAARAIIEAWDDWASDSGDEYDGCEELLDSAVAHTKTLLISGRVPSSVRPTFEAAVEVLTATESAPNLTFSEAVDLLREFVEHPERWGAQIRGKLLSAQSLTPSQRPVNRGVTKRLTASQAPQPRRTTC